MYTIKFCSPIDFERGERGNRYSLYTNGIIYRFTVMMYRHTQQITGKGRGKRQVCVCLCLCVCVCTRTRSHVWILRVLNQMFDPYKSIGIKLYWFLREWRQTCITKHGAGFDGTGGNGGHLEWSGLAPLLSLMMMVVVAAAALGTGGLSRCTGRASGSPRRSPASWARCTWTPPVVLYSGPSLECCPGWGRRGHTSYIPELCVKPHCNHIFYGNIQLLFFSRNKCSLYVCLVETGQQFVL